MCSKFYCGDIAKGKKTPLLPATASWPGEYVVRRLDTNVSGFRYSATPTVDPLWEQTLCKMVGCEE